jgi:hypothetical protein
MNVVASTYIHALEGRLRIKLPKIKRAAIKAREVERHLQQLTGVEEVSANPTTGNVLILYNPRVNDQRELFFLPNGIGISVSTPGRERDNWFSLSRGKNGDHRGRHHHGSRLEAFSRRLDLKTLLRGELCPG